MTLIESQNIFLQSARRFADHYREYSRINEKDFEALKNEMENLFSSIELYKHLKAWQEVAETIQHIDDFLEVYGYWKELVAGYRVAVESIDKCFWMQGRDPKPEIWHKRIFLRTQLSLILFRRGEYQEARSHATEALKIARQIKHPELQALASSTLGTVAMAQGEFRESESLYENSRSLLNGKVLRKDVLLQLRQKGVLADSQGDLEKAQEFYVERLKLALDGNDNLDAAESLYSLGDIETTKRNYKEAESLYEQSQSLYEKADSPIGLSNVLNRKAQLFIRTKRFQEAKQVLNQQLEIERKHGDRASLLDTLQDIANNYLDLEEIDLAEQFYKEANELANRLGNLPAQIISFQGLGFIEQVKGNSLLAHDYYQNSLRIARISGHPKLISVILSRLGNLALHEQDYQTARNYFNEVLKFEHKLNRRDQVARTILTLGDLARFDGNFRIAERKYNQAMKLFSDLGSNDGMADCLIALSSISFQKSKYDEAWQLLSRSVEIGNLKADTYLLNQVVERLGEFVLIPNFKERVASLAVIISNRNNI
jgi:tetratricopeptide (TPR) repeat protein